MKIKLSKERKRIFFLAGMFLILALAIVASLSLRKPSSESDTTGAGSKTGMSAGTSSGTAKVQAVPLSEEEKKLFAEAVLSSIFIKDLPEKYPIKISFFDFQGGQRRWRSSFLFNNKGFLSSGTPEISIILHAKYISELNSGDLCEIIQRANKAGDLGFSSQSTTFSLLIKYAGILKHRACFGF